MQSNADSKTSIDWYDVIFKEEVAQYFFGEPGTSKQPLAYHHHELPLARIRTVQLLFEVTTYSFLLDYTAPERELCCDSISSQGGSNPIRCTHNLLLPYYSDHCHPEANTILLILVYEDFTTFNLRGIDELTGVTVEVPATYIKSSAAHPIKFLSEVLQWVDTEVEKVRQAAADTARGTIHAPLTPPTTQAGDDTEDGHYTITRSATTPVTANDARIEHQPLSHSPAGVVARDKGNTEPGGPETPYSAPSPVIIRKDDDVISISSSSLSSLEDDENFMQIDIARSVRQEETLACEHLDDNTDEDEKMEADEDYEVEEPPSEESPSLVDRVKTRTRIPTRRPL